MGSTGFWWRIPALTPAALRRLPSLKLDQNCGSNTSSGGCNGSNDGHIRDKYDLVLNPLLRRVLPQNTSVVLTLLDKEAHSTHETSLIQAVCRSPHGLRLGQVELLQHKIPESVERVVHS